MGAQARREFSQGCYYYCGGANLNSKPERDRWAGKPPTRGSKQQTGQHKCRPYTAPTLILLRAHDAGSRLANSLETKGGGSVAWSRLRLTDDHQGLDAGLWPQFQERLLPGLLCERLSRLGGNYECSSAAVCRRKLRAPLRFETSLNRQSGPGNRTRTELASSFAAESSISRNGYPITSNPADGAALTMDSDASYHPSSHAP